MGFNNRMNIVKKSLDLFIRSLPAGCKFSIIQFGSRFETMKFKDNECMILDDETSEFVLNEIRGLKNNFGGTNIIEPLKFAQSNW